MSCFYCHRNILDSCGIRFQSLRHPISIERRCRGLFLRSNQFYWKHQSRLQDHSQRYCSIDSVCFSFLLHLIIPLLLRSRMLLVHEMSSCLTCKQNIWRDSMIEKRRYFRLRISSVSWFRQCLHTCYFCYSFLLSSEVLMDVSIIVLRLIW